MAMTETSKEYGTALFMLACENNKKDEYANGLSILVNTFKENPQYLEFLASPGISLAERLEALDSAFSDILETEVMSYIKLLCEKGRISSFFESCEQYNALLEESRRVTKVTVTCAVALTEEEKEKLVKNLENKFKSTVDAEYIIDESLIGGILVEADGKVLDGSVRTRLRDIKDVMNR